MTDRKYDHGDAIVATFNPKRLDTLRDEARPLIGMRLTWHYLWYVTEEDGGAYVGQPVFETRDVESWVGWVPLEDLDDVATTHEEHEA